MSFDPFLEWFVLPFLREKAKKSVSLAVYYPKAPMPLLGSAGQDGLLHPSTIEAINNQLSKLPYRADPLLFDYYTHPGVTQKCLDTGNWGDWSCDCDDFAVYAYALFRLTGAKPGQGFWIWNLIIDPTQQLWNAWANHVILGFRQWDQGRFKTGVLDTNSAEEKKVIWFDLPPEQAETAVLKYFGEKYKVQYYRAIRVDYPF
ncbi:hypothetical protein COW20_15345 [bacterium (Candidatus Blackallbacteria) CG13_big_fil_rev_8_21_14_2_50_49_14]|nr:MAG: hypothetical protein COW64_15185 [bacterium (Candidatus Blackallbacteria) CG18_big_fil_WC_8_21_14_2_50_49_26]PIW46662.1 MAG: hypothetical protein COW20_15345 [bacterium (Candidatus Blackallbacteria) CG13_big_fil_rev_8_21_14_2_50_49_14]